MFLLDVSGSTSGQADYYDKVLNIYEKLVAIHGVANIVIIMWDDKAAVSTEVALRSRVRHRLGGGGTYPKVFSGRDMTPENSQLVIITDGQVDSADVDTCDRIVNGRLFRGVTVWFIETGGQMNLSVSSPFTRNCENVTINVRRLDPVKRVFGDVLLMHGNTRDPVSIQKYFGNPELFLAELDSLTGVVMLQNVGKDVNLPLRNSLLDLQKNLLAVLAKRASDGNGWKALDDLLTSHPTPDSYSLGVALCRELSSCSSGGAAKQIEAAIANLIRLCTGNKDFSFNNLSSRAVRAEAVAVVAVEDVPQPEKIAKTYECPIAMDDDLPVLPIVAGVPVLGDLDAKYLDYLFSMPLCLLNDQKLVERVWSRLGHIIGHGIAAELFRRSDASHPPASPQTRDVITSVLLPCVPTTYDDRKVYVKANVHALASIFFGDKLVGDAGVWLAVVWQCLKLVTRFAEDENFMHIFEKFLAHDWKLRTTNITMSGLPIEPMVKVPLSTAMWYCLASFDVITNMGKNNLIKDDERNRLRGLGLTVKHLTACVDLLGYSYDKDFVLEMVKIYQAFSWMMQHEKDPNSKWRLYIRAQWQNSHYFPESKNIVLLDGPVVDQSPTFLLPECFNGISVGIIVTLMNRVDLSKKTNEIFLPREILPSPIPDAVTNYGYPEMPKEWIRARIHICPETCRPYVIDRKERKKWNECAERMYGPISKQCCNFKYFIDFVFQKDRYPANIEEFILYIADKQANRLGAPVDTSPRYQFKFIEGLFHDYEAVLGKGFVDVPVEEFKKKTWNSMREEDRRRLDGSDLI